MTLKKYYSTLHWRNFRFNITKDKECQCEICGMKRWEKYKKKDVWKPAKRIEIHHLTYDTIGKESRQDVLALCSHCHKFCHLAELMSRTRNGVFKTIYQLILDGTKWEYKKR